jgi:excisionase family DNA binding protein
MGATITNDEVLAAVRELTENPELVERLKSLAGQRVLVTADELSLMTGIGRGRVYEMMADQRLPSVQIGSRRRVFLPLFLDWLAREAAASFDGERLRECVSAA